ncbi:YkvI family membrane protein [Ectobacillus ponti]|uniref:Membrane protein YkvI n=1 Tax=Ectobacillus ponti TaxID=2961894 RepID=A0AA42BPZ4_9BACI|nr:hypothetical protein [Ectobacillus ponti]MCP8968876.1 hypothetical protein [Ectobacillus ponti]
MNDQQWKVAKKIAATYIGTIVGAGFATGREIVEFFTMYGTYGFLGILGSGLLFMWLGTRMMLLSMRIRAYSAQEFNKYLFGDVFGNIVNMVLLLVLLGVTSVMLSGAGAVFQEQLNWPRQLGVLLTVFVCIFISTRGLSGVFGVNSLVVPIMMLFIIGLFSTTLSQAWPILTNSVPQEEWNWRWVTSPITYVAMNLALSQSVLVPLAYEVNDEKAVRAGGMLGGAGLCLILICSQFALLSVPDFAQYNIPMAEVVRRFNPVFHFFFVFVIYGEIFTTLIGNVFGMTKQLQSMAGWRSDMIIYVLLAVSYCISYIGYGDLLHTLYPLIGWISLVLLPLLAIKQANR